MKQTTLCFLVKEGEVLLAMKKRRFGAGRWNGVGGKLEPGEDVLTAALREMEEEIGVRVRPEHMEHRGKLRFYFPPDKADWDQEVHIFLIRRWEGEPTESEEMSPRWFTPEALPFSEMWPDDPHWLPLVLAGKSVEGEFYFADGGNSFREFKVRETGS